MVHQLSFTLFSLTKSRVYKKIGSKMPLLLENPGLYNSVRDRAAFWSREWEPGSRQREAAFLQKDMASRRGANSFLSAGLPFVTFIVGGSYMLSEVGPTRTGEVQPPDDTR